MGAFLAGFKSGFGSFSKTVTIIINTALLLAVYLLGVGLTSVAAKLVGKRFFGTSPKATYWHPTAKRKEEYYRQF